MNKHFVVKNEAGEYFVGFARKVNHPDFPFVPKFGMLVDEGFSLAVVFDYAKKQEVEEALHYAGIKYTLIEV